VTELGIELTCQRHQRTVRMTNKFSNLFNFHNPQISDDPSESDLELVANLLEA
jgi:hypothetical protein